MSNMEDIMIISRKYMTVYYKKNVPGICLIYTRTYYKTTKQLWKFCEGAAILTIKKIIWKFVNMHKVIDKSMFVIKCGVFH